MRAVLKLALVLCVVTLRFTNCQIYEVFKRNETLGKIRAKYECENSLVFETITNDVDHPFSNDLHQDKVSIAYGNYLVFACYGADATRLTIKRDGEVLPIEKVKQTVVKWSIRRPNVQRSEYVCTDVETGCVRSVLVTVRPAFEVESSNGQFSADRFHKTYTMQYGDSLSMLCAGSSRLVIVRNGKELQTKNVGNNTNTVRCFVSKPDLQISEYVCIDIGSAVNSTLHIRVVPRIYMQTEELTSNQTFKYGLFRYGDAIEIFCSGPRAVKLIYLGEDNVKEILTESLNSNTVKSLIRNVKIGESIYACIDSEVPDYASTVRLEVRPRMEVVSANVRLVGREYVTKNGIPVEILCSGPSASQLAMFKDDFIKNVLQLVNETTAKWIIKPEINNDHTTYFCQTEESGIAAVSEVSLTIADFTKAVDFRCVSHNVQLLNCSWRSETDIAHFSLFYTSEGKSVSMCTKVIFSMASLSCVWEGVLRSEKTLNFIMESCNFFGCSNQTYSIDQLSVVKPNRPWGLRIHRTRANGTVLRWGGEKVYCAGVALETRTGDFLYKVEYWYSGIQPLEVNSSLVSCVMNDCQIDLNLPCPGMSYQVWVYQRLRAVDIWSDPSSINVYIDGDRDVAGCNSKPKVTTEVMQYFIQQLRHEVHIGKAPLRKKLSLLKAKRDRIRAYLDEL